MKYLKPIHILPLVLVGLLAGIVIWKISGNQKTETAGDKNHAAAKESTRNFGINA